MYCSLPKKLCDSELSRLVTPCCGIAAASLALAAVTELNLPLGPWGTIKLPDNSTIPREWAACRDHQAALVRHKDSYAYLMTQHQLPTNRSNRWWRSPIHFVTRNSTLLTNEIGVPCDLVAFPVYNFGWQGGFTIGGGKSVDCWLIEKNGAKAMALALHDYPEKFQRVHGGNIRQANVGSDDGTHNLRGGASGSPVISEEITELFGILKGSQSVTSLGRNYVDLYVVNCTTPAIQQQVRAQADQGLGTSIINRLVLRFERVACIWGGILAVAMGTWLRIKRNIS